MQTTTNKKAKTRAIDKINNLQLPGIPALQFVPLELIETATQIRTEFCQESIEELAGDIKARGMLQPVLLRPLADGKFLMIAGERRLRAARFAELDNIPALIGEVDDETAALMQLAENIHREKLDPMDECRAIEKLYNRLGSLDKVADIVKKSKPWCSKRYAMTKTDLHHTARQLLEDGITEDIELLKALSSLCKLIPWDQIKIWKDGITSGELGRKEVRAGLKNVKQLAKDKKEKGAGKVSHAKSKEPLAPIWTIETSMEKLSEALTYCDADKIAVDEFNSWEDEKKRDVEERLNKMTSIGGSVDGFKLIGQLVVNGLYNTPYFDIDLMAMIAGHRKNEPLNITTFLEQLQTPKETA